MTLRTLILRLCGCRRSKQQRLIQGVPQGQCSLNIASQVGRHNHVAGNAAAAIGNVSDYRQSNADNAVIGGEGRSLVEEYNSRVPNIAAGQAQLGLGLNLRGSRVGVVGQDGLHRFWEWDDAQACYVPLELSRAS